MVAVLFVFNSSTARAQDAGDPKVWADGLFNTLLNRGEDAFQDELKTTWANKYVTLFTDQVVGYFSNTRKLGGPLTGYEYVSQQQVGPRLRSLKYITYNENFFLVSQLAFYKGSHGWELIGVSMNSEADKIPWE